MKYKYYVIIFLLQIFISCFCYAGKDEIEILFFDVGQGNCTLIKPPEAPYILVDAGSSVKCIKTDPTIQKQKIIAHIGKITQLKIKHEYDLHVIVSHPDKDHINWIQDVTDPKHYNKQKGLKINFLLGGAEEDYDTNEAISLINYIKKNVEYKYSFVSPFDPFENKSISYDHFQLIPLNLSDHTGDSNTDSIVLKVVFGNISAILTGDATGATTSNILAIAKWKDYLKTMIPSTTTTLGNFDNVFGLKDLKSNILQASHHGSYTDGSNNQLWFETINPEFVVCSAGQHNGFFHPDFAVPVCAYGIPNSRLTEKNKKHTFLCGKTSNHIGNNLFRVIEEEKEEEKMREEKIKKLKKEINKIKERVGKIEDKGKKIEKETLENEKKELEKKYFRTMKTEYGIYNTNDSGTVVFKWKLSDTIISPSFQ